MAVTRVTLLRDEDGGEVENTTTRVIRPLQASKITKAVTVAQLGVNMVQNAVASVTEPTDPYENQVWIRIIE